MKKYGLALGLLLMSTVEFDCTPVARAQTAPPSVADVYPGTISTPAVWTRANSEAELSLLNPSPRTQRAAIVWQIRSLAAARRIIWTQKTMSGATPARVRPPQNLAFGPYEITASIGAKTSRANFVVAPRFKASPDVVILANENPREAAARWTNLGVGIAANVENSKSASRGVETVFFAKTPNFSGTAKQARYIDVAQARLAPANWLRAPRLPLAVRWPEDSAACAAQTSASSQRALQANARWFGKVQPYVAILPVENCGNAGQETAMRVATAWAAGASRVFVSAENAADALSADEARRMAALGALHTMRDGARFERELFSASPLLRGVALVGKGRRGALIWLERNANPRARLVVPLKAQIFDVWGNEIGRDRKGVLVVPLNAPIWVQSAASEKEWRRAWANARLENTRLLAAQVLPFARATQMREIRVRLQNTGIAPLAGTLSVAPPAGWKMAQNSVNYRLGAGESQVFRFAVAATKARADDLYSVGVVATRGATRWAWKQSARVASAEEIVAPPTIDADLGEWKDAAWMLVRSEKAEARLAMRWDLTRLYVAAEVREKEFRDAMPEEFWRGSAIQLAFGMRIDAPSRPQNGPFRDTDYGFLLVPWRGDDGALGARVLRLWNESVPFDGWNGNVLDRKRWGGAVPQSFCAVRRDAVRGITTYEASFPTREMPTLRPARRANAGIGARFSFLVHSPNSPPLSWGRANNVFAWWGNAVSFQNGGAISPAAQVPLQFVALPPRELLPPLPSAAPPISPRISIPATVPTIQPEARRAPETGSAAASAAARASAQASAETRRATPKKRPRPPRKSPPRNDTFEPPQLEPMSPRTLPPAAPPTGIPISPAPAVPR